jgi:hypothetical protein
LLPDSPDSVGRALDGRVPGFCGPSWVDHGQSGIAGRADARPAAALAACIQGVFRNHEIRLLPSAKIGHPAACKTRKNFRFFKNLKRSTLG